MKLFEQDTPSLNDNSFVNLPEGTAIYTIKKCFYRQRKNSGEGVVAFSFLSEDNRTYTHEVAIGAKHDVTRKIAASTMKAMWDACKLQGDADLDRLPNFVEKRVELNVRHTQGTTAAGEPTTYTNIQSVFPADRAPATPPADDDEIPMGNDSPAPSEEPAAEPAPKRTFTLKKKAATT